MSDRTFTPQEAEAETRRINRIIDHAAAAMAAVPSPPKSVRATLSLDPAVRDERAAYDTAEAFRAGIARAALRLVSHSLSCGAPFGGGGDPEYYDRDATEEAIMTLPDDTALMVFGHVREFPPAPGAAITFNNHPYFKPVVRS